MATLDLTEMIKTAVCDVLGNETEYNEDMFNNDNWACATSETVKDALCENTDTKYSVLWIDEMRVRNIIREELTKYNLIKETGSPYGSVSVFEKYKLKHK